MASSSPLTGFSAHPRADSRRPFAVSLLQQLRNIAAGFLLGTGLATAVVVSGMPENEQQPKEAPPLPLQESSVARELKPFPGRIETTSFVLEPPAELLLEPLYADPYCFWGFPEDWSREQIESFLAESGLTPEEIAAVTSEKRFIDPGVAAGYFPPAEVVFALDPPRRQRLYQRLGNWPFNAYHAIPFDFGTLRISDLAAMAPHPFSEKFLARADATLYREGIKNHFADYPAFASQLADQGERLAFARLLFRTRCQMATLAPFAPEEAPAILAYWDAHERNPDALPLLEPAMQTRTGEAINLLHLLPPVPRSLLFTFATEQSMVGKLRPDCFWTTRNFFSREISQRFLDVTYEDTSFDGWLPAVPPYELGDVILVVDRENPTVVYHACNYIARDLVFTKNGTSRIRPWVVQTLEDMKAVYHRDEVTELRFLRHRSVMPVAGE